MVKSASLFQLLACRRDDKAEELRTTTRYIQVLEPEKADAGGLVNCLGKAMEDMGISNILDKTSVLGVRHHPILIGMGTDGATVNLGEQNGLKAIVQKELPWLFWSWCFAHRLELSCRDSLSSQLFKDIVDMLLRIYYLYEKSPQKCRDLAAIVVELKEVYHLPDGGNIPIRSSGSRWINHKRKALQRIVDRYGAYMAHLTSLVADQGLKSTDRQRLKGYLREWTDTRILLGCALYIDILEPPSLLSLHVLAN